MTNKIGESKMFKGKSLPIGTLFIVLVIMLALLGVGYALWSETLTIEGSVMTGEVDVELVPGDLRECVDTQTGLCEDEPPEKNWAECSIEEFGPDGDSNADDGIDRLVVTVNGMYPSWHCKVPFTVRNIGGVPVHVKLPVPTDDIPEWVATDFDGCYVDSVQLHRFETTSTCTIDIHFTNDQAPPENSGPYTFGWTILAHQWNEDPAPPPATRYEKTLGFNPTGWAGLSCPLTEYAVGHGVLVGTANTYLWEPGVTAGGFTYPLTPFGYPYAPGETGMIIQNDGDGNETITYYVDCLPKP
jgi:hypothetical protein